MPNFFLISEKLFYPRECQVESRLSTWSFRRFVQVRMEYPLQTQFFNAASPIGELLIAGRYDSIWKINYKAYSGTFPVQIFQLAVPILPGKRFLRNGLFKYLADGAIFPNKDSALLAEYGSLASEDGSAIRFLMDNSDLTKLRSKEGFVYPVWLIQRNGSSSPINFDERRIAVLRRIVACYPNPQLKVLCSISGANEALGWRNIGPSVWGLPRNISVESLYDILTANSFLLFSAVPDMSEIEFPIQMLKDPDKFSQFLNSHRFMLMLMGDSEENVWMISGHEQRERDYIESHS